MRMAWLTVGRLAPVSWARSRSDGSRAPSGSRAETISCSIRPAISCAATGSPSRCPAGARRTCQTPAPSVCFDRANDPSPRLSGNTMTGTSLTAGFSLAVEVVLAAFPHVVDGRADVLAAVYGVPAGNVPEHLDAEAAVEVFHDAALPGTADDLRRQPADRPRLGHDVVGDREAARDQLLARYDLVDQAVLQCLAGIDRLPGEQRVGGALGAEQLLHGVVYPVGGDRADVIVQVEQHGVFRRDGDVAHREDLGVEARPVHQADRRDLQVVDQCADVDPPVLVGVLVR